MRFESKHTFSKRAVRSLHNFINITKSFSEKHALFQSLIRLGAYLRFEVETNNSFPFEKHLYSEELQAAVMNKLGKVCNFLHTDNKNVYAILEIFQNTFRPDLRA